MKEIMIGELEGRGVDNGELGNWGMDAASNVYVSRNLVLFIESEE